MIEQFFDVSPRFQELDARAMERAAGIREIDAIRDYNR